MVIMKIVKERCDHCKKWISSKHQTDIFTLEGTVSPQIDFNFGICIKCVDRQYSREYWDNWVLTNGNYEFKKVILS